MLVLSYLLVLNHHNHKKQHIHLCIYGEKYFLLESCLSVSLEEGDCVSVRSILEKIILSLF